MKNFAIACMSGTLKGVFIQGVLNAFEEAGLKAEVYASTSSSTIPTTYAAIGELRRQGLGNWDESNDILSKPGNSMSNVVLHGIEIYSPLVIEKLKSNELSRLMIVCSYVKNSEAKNLTQGNSAVTLGRKLIIKGARHISDWKDENLEMHIFDTHSDNKELKLTADIYKQVAYATTRMLHAWHIPATINGKPYIDGNYTCTIPIEPLAQKGYKNIIAIATEPGDIYKDFFSDKTFNDEVRGSKVYWIKPEENLKNLGVDFTKTTKDGIENVFNYGIAIGDKFIRQHFKFSVKRKVC